MVSNRDSNEKERRTQNEHRCNRGDRCDVARYAGRCGATRGRYWPWHDPHVDDFCRAGFHPVDDFGRSGPGLHHSDDVGGALWHANDEPLPRWEVIDSIAGLGGIIGNPRRPRRRSDEQYTQCLKSLLEHRTDILITHDDPNDPVGGQRGSPTIREIVERLRPSLVIRGHAHWKQPLVRLSGGVQVLNVDARVVVLRE